MLPTRVSFSLPMTLANKMARIVWALLVCGNTYQAPAVSVAMT
jgi:hypothetical protein